MKNVRDFKNVLDIVKVANWIIIVLVLGAGIAAAQANPFFVIAAAITAGVFYILITLALGVGYCAVQIAENTFNGEAIKVSTPKTKELQTASVKDGGKTKLSMSSQCTHEGCYERTNSAYNDKPLCDEHAST